MIFTDDMKELVSLFDEYHVLYVLVGGFAVNFYGYVRTTQDMDILVYPSRENAKNVMHALQEFGFGQAGIPIAYFEIEGTAIHLGVEPNRIDLLTHVQGVSNDHIFKNVKKVTYDDVLINIISREDLVDCKRSSKRMRDLADADELERIEKEKK